MTEQQPPQQPPPDRLSDILKLLLDRIEPIIKLYTSVAERKLKTQQLETRFRAHMSWVAVAVIVLIVLVAGALTYLDKIDGSTFTFLLGTIVGYVLTFIRDWIAAPTEDRAD